MSAPYEMLEFDKDDKVDDAESESEDEPVALGLFSGKPIQSSVKRVGQKKTADEPKETGLFSGQSTQSNVKQSQPETPVVKKKRGRPKGNGSASRK
jgi:hypothetical protein